MCPKTGTWQIHRHYVDKWRSKNVLYICTKTDQNIKTDQLSGHCSSQKIWNVKNITCVKNLWDNILCDWILFLPILLQFSCATFKLPFSEFEESQTLVKHDKLLCSILKRTHAFICYQKSVFVSSHQGTK